MSEIDLFTYIGDAVAEELSRVEEEHRLSLDTKIHSYVMAGKRVRPLTFLMAVQGTRPELLQTRDVRRACAAIEITHRSTLISDDIVDGQDIRNGSPTLANVGGYALAVLAAPLLQAVGLEVCPPRYRELINSGVRDTLAGQILQERQRLFSIQEAFQENERVVKLKSSSIGAAGLIIAKEIIGGDGWSDHNIQELSRLLARGYQTCNDLADIVNWVSGESATVPPDIKNRTATLPILFALMDSQGTDRRILNEHFLHQFEKPAADLAPVFERLGVIEKCLRIVDINLDRACDFIGRLLPRNDVRDRLAHLVHSEWRNAYLTTGG